MRALVPLIVMAMALPALAQKPQQVAAGAHAGAQGTSTVSATIWQTRTSTSFWTVCGTRTV